MALLPKLLLLACVALCSLSRPVAAACDAKSLSSKGCKAKITGKSATLTCGTQKQTFRSTFKATCDAKTSSWKLTSAGCLVRAIPEYSNKWCSKYSFTLQGKPYCTPQGCLGGGIAIGPTDWAAYPDLTTVELVCEGPNTNPELGPPIMAFRYKCTGKKWVQGFN